MKEAIWVLGGLFVGSSILMMLGQFNGQSGVGIAGPEGEFGGHASQVYYSTGYDTVADLTLFGQGWLALVLGAVGLGMLVYVNANAWKDTGGY